MTEHERLTSAFWGRREIEWCGSPGHTDYPLPPLPGDFSWSYLELAAPVEAITLISLAEEAQ